MLTSNHPFASPAVYKRDIPADQSLNVTHLLEKRVYYPPDQLCNNPRDWVARRCIAVVSDRLWWDVCLGMTMIGDPYLYVRGGFCAENAMCFNIFVDSQNPDDPAQTPTSVCIERPQLLTVINTAPDGIMMQSGVVAVAGDTNPQQTMSIRVLNGISKASVSAFIEGAGTYKAITPSANIFGSMSGTSPSPNACNWNSTDLVCVPAGRNNIPALATLLFTFSLLSNQRGSFYYAVIGS